MTNNKMKTCMSCRKKVKTLLIGKHGLYICRECWDLEEHRYFMNEYYSQVLP
jgi:hypothetical protein